MWGTSMASTIMLMAGYRYLFTDHSTHKRSPRSHEARHLYINKGCVSLTESFFNILGSAWKSYKMA